MNKILNSLRLMVGRCVVMDTRTENGEMLADLELIAGEKRRGVEFLQQFGFSSRPMGDVSGLALFVGGNRDNGILIATNADGKSPELKKGEVCLFSPHGQKILLKEDGSVEVSAAAGKKIKLVNDVECSGNFDCTGNVKATGDVEGLNVAAKVEVSAAAGIIHLTKHTHICTAPESPSGPPVG